MTDEQSWCIGEARNLGRAIAERAVPVKDGSVAWRDPMADKPAGLNPHFYEGTTGVAFFLGALAAVLGPAEGQEMADLARRAIAPIRQQLRRLAGDPERAAAIEIKLGAVVGLGAYIYCFVQLAGWLEEPELVREAQILATLVTAERIARDRSLDVATGSAGALLALLRLERALPAGTLAGQRPLERAGLCGAHLLSRRVAHRDEPPAWSTDGLRPFCGFLHGAAGFAYALHRLAQAARDPDPELGRAVDQALAFERFHFAPAAGNWPDLRGDGSAFMVAYCHGAAGVALSRLGLLPERDAPALRAELGVALATTRDCPEQAADHLCCGNLGRAEILHGAARALGDAELGEAARRLVRQTVEKARERGRYRYSHDLRDSRFSPVFFRGAAGAGYTLLRFAYPESLPCVLTFQ